jgi:ubiquinone/menaquinone biosynthesis C-methylase UbiE
MPRVANYWNTIAAEFDSIYTGAAKSNLSRRLDQVFRKDIYQRFAWVMNKCGDVRGKSVCDIGCGSGRFVAELGRRGAARITGVDVASEMLKVARELAEQNRVADHCDFVLSDVLHWKADRTFDITLAIGFWDYIADPPQRLRVIRQFTRGTFLSAWPRFWTWRTPVRKVRLEYIRGCPVYFFRKPRVYEMIENAGFEIVNSETIGQLYCVEARPK